MVALSNWEASIGVNSLLPRRALLCLRGLSLVLVGVPPLVPLVSGSEPGGPGSVGGIGGTGGGCTGIDADASLTDSEVESPAATPPII